MKIMMKEMIKKWLDKKKYNQKIRKIKNDYSLLFQLIIYYDDIPRIQVLRQGSIMEDPVFRNFKLKKNDLVFFIQIGTNSSLLSNFKKSKYYDNHIKFDNEKGIYAFLSSGEFENIDSITLDIMNNILEFNKDYTVSLKLL